MYLNYKFNHFSKIKLHLIFIKLGDQYLKSVEQGLVLILLFLHFVLADLMTQKIESNGGR